VFLNVREKRKAVFLKVREERKAVFLNVREERKAVFLNVREEGKVGCRIRAACVPESKGAEEGRVQN
jgi:hypothetical protein